MNNNLKNYTMTKIVATLGPVSCTKEKIRELLDAGVTMFRINSSHGDEEFHKRNIAYIRELEQEQNRLIPILLDLQGPKIRIGKLPESIELHKDEILRFRHQDELQDGVIPVDYKGMAGDVSSGELILIDDGKIQLEVTGVEGDIINAKVLTDGLLKQRKGINIPGSTGSVKVLTQRDVEFVNFAIEQEIDYLGLSFVRDANDVIKLRGLLDAKDSETRIISKIEKPQAVENIDSIIEVSDGIMVARGDLGIEISTEHVPMVQKTIVKKANAKRKAVIVATQMLESMIENPIPTRAETSDVANAILDGADAIMLSGETAAGAYPVDAVQMMYKIARATEDGKFIKYNRFPKQMIEEEKDGQTMAIAMSISDMVKKMNIKAVIALSGSGYTAASLSEGRLSVPVFVCCPNYKIRRALKLYRGVHPFNFDCEIRLEAQSLQTLDKVLIKEIGLASGDTVIITGSLPDILVGGTNFIKIHEIS
jgi:pyruvate kinase